MFKLYLLSKHGTELVDKLFYQIQMLVIRSLISVQPVMINDKHCFELYGYDVMIDAELVPWLIEVNASPSLSANTPADYQMKCEMLNDMLDIVDMERNLNGDEEQIGGFDLIYSKSRVITDQNCIYTSYLGCEVPPPRKRVRNAKKRSGATSTTSSGQGLHRAGSMRSRRNTSSNRPESGSNSSGGNGSNSRTTGSDLRSRRGLGNISKTEKKIKVVRNNNTTQSRSSSRTRGATDEEG